MWSTPRANATRASRPGPAAGPCTQGKAAPPSTRSAISRTSNSGLRARDIELKLNDFASAYGKFDFNAGHGDVVIEAQAEKGRLNGYIKPLLRDVDVFNWQQDVEKRTRASSARCGRPWWGAAKPC